MTSKENVALAKSIDAYNEESNQAYLKALTGGEGSWKRHEPRTNIGDLLGSSSNDNSPEPVQLDLFHDTPFAR